MNLKYYNTNTMNKFLVFLGGFVTGILVTFLVAYMFTIANKPNDGLLGLTIYAEAGECIEIDGQLKIIQVLEPNIALAMAEDFLVVLIVNNEGKTYYDDQRIKIPANKCARQIGTYEYNTNSTFQKTVPAVEIK